ncbi:DUF3017 domain-containing protein [Cellulomonas sp.]|uniref:DUF3017 domain-containing protein n=1 Tax=Cellulomonas sp. TaxID=40001 RepID=UPI001B13140E|nr:DUF3017 domain-containing protein [Cellulomonas sp.]MBO9554267.1 DUF3017 domain-containing protein [Cellulomonas sp.]
MVQERVHGGPVGRPVEAPAGTGPVPVEEAALDPRSIARASLQASRNASLWWTSAGILVSVAVALLVSTRAGALALAAVAAVCAVVRLVLPSPGPVAVSVRSRPFDVLVLLMFAGGIGFLALILPAGSR